MRTFEEGSLAPEFEIEDQNGELFRLADHRGTPIVLYFYPKDNTPGCTKEACGFRDAYAEYTEKGIKVIGVSPDSAKKHTGFIEKFQLPFTLLADVEHKVCELYGVWGLKKMMGREYMGVFRTTFVIDAEGKVLKIYDKVKPEEHAQEILSLFEA